MILARVVGNVVATVKTPSHTGSKLLVCETVNPDATGQDGTLIAVDAGQAGIGDYVLIVQEGNSCRLLMNRKDGAVDSVIVGVVDYVETAGTQYKLQDRARENEKAASAQKAK